MLKRITIISCLLLFLGSWGMGQRIVGTIDPNTEFDFEEDLRFDSNWMPVSQTTIDQNNIAAQSYGRTIDLNFCPNVVFTPDSSRGFVSYTGSDTVMVFDPKTYEVISLIDVPANPGHLVISPDGTKVAFPNHYLASLIPDAQDLDPLAGGVSVIDTDTLEVTSVYFDDLAFSFYNNIIFSEDGSIIYIPAIRNDQMLRLDSETLAEIGTRMEFFPGTRPASMTRIPNTNDVAVVLVGSNNLDRDAHPDGLAIVDLDQFEIMNTIYPKVDEDSTDSSLLVDFTSTTTVSFSTDGKWGAIADQELSSMAALPSLSSDRLWILDLENEEFYDYVYCSGMAGSTYWIPSTEEFVVAGAMSLLIVDPQKVVDGDDDATRVITPSRSDFRARSSIELLEDGRTLMIPSPSYDSIMVIDYVDNITMRGVVTGGLFIRDPSEEKDCDLCVECVDDCNTLCEEAYEESDQEEEDYEDYQDCVEECSESCEEVCDGCEYLMEGPMQIAYTPDREVFVVVSFNNNVIYVVEDTYHFSIPKLWVNDDDLFAGVALVNPSENDAELWGAAYASSGLVLVDDPDTEDEVEFANPVLVDLSAGHQKTFVAEELIEPSIQDSFTGWIDMDSDSEGVSALMLYGDHDLKSLDGLVSHNGNYRRMIFPDIRVEGTTLNGELNILNPNLKSGDVEINLYNEFGGMVSTFSFPISTKSFYSVILKDINATISEDAGLFSETVWDNFNYGYIEVLSTEGALQGFQRILEDDKMSIINAWGEGSLESESTDFYVPIAVTLHGAETWVNVINTNYADDEDDDGDGEDDDLDDENIWVTIKFHTDYGAVLSETLVLIARNSYRIELSDLFDLYEIGDYVTGWLEITSDRAGLAGNVELRLSDENATQLPLQVLSSGEFLLGHVAEGFGIETGIAMVNPTDQDALATMTVFNGEGEITGEAVITIPAQSHLTQLLKEYIPGFADQTGGYIKINSDSSIVVQELFYKQDLEYVASVVPM